MGNDSLFKGLVKVARENPATRKHLVPLLHKYAVADKHWPDGSPSAPKTPWGPAQTGYKLANGVWWFSTAGHGGLMVSRAMAQAKLSGAARKMGEVWSGAFWYEEDVQYAVAFYEVPEWMHSMAQSGGGGVLSAEKLEQTIRHWEPKYFELKEQGYTMPSLPKKGATVEFKDTVTFRGGQSFKPWDNAVVTQVTRSRVIVMGIGGGYYGIPARMFYEGKVVVV